MRVGGPFESDVPVQVGGPVRVRIPRDSRATASSPAVVGRTNRPVRIRTVSVLLDGRTFTASGLVGHVTRDVIIAGTGPAGLAAGIYAGRAGLDTLFFEKESIGGELVNRDEIRSYPGFPDGVSGTDFRSSVIAELDEYDSEVRLAEIRAVEPGDPVEVVTDEEVYEGKALILATGSRSRPLDVPGEEEFDGRGVFYCAKCDGPLYHGETVAVAGGGNKAMIDAIGLSEFASEIVIVVDGPSLSADEHLREEVEALSNVEVVPNSRIVEIVGEDGAMDSLRVTDSRDGTERELAADGLFVHVGSEPNTEFLDGVVPTGEDGRVLVNERMETEVAGIYAAGDVRQGSPLEIASAVGDGVTAITWAKRYIDR